MTLNQRHSGNPLPWRGAPRFPVSRPSLPEAHRQYPIAPWTGPWFKKILGVRWTVTCRQSDLVIRQLCPPISAAGARFGYTLLSCDSSEQPDCDAAQARRSKLEFVTGRDLRSACQGKLFAAVSIALWVVCE